MSISPSWILFLMLVAGISLGFVWFSGTSIASALRGLGVPVPYCTFMRPSSSAELDFTRVSPGYLFDSNDVIAFLSFSPGDQLMTTLCSVSDRGVNVRLILSPMLSKDRSLLSFLDKCKIKYRVSDARLPNLVVSGSCVMTLGYDRDVVVCEDGYAGEVRRYLEGMWNG